MYREMRRRRQQLGAEECRRILKTADYGVLALNHEGDPYAVPLSFAMAEDRLYFHGAPAGQKLEAARAGGRASFCVVAQARTVPERLTVSYRSVIVLGRIRVVGLAAEKEAALTALAAKYAPGADASGIVSEAAGKIAILRLDIERISGKQSLDQAAAPVAGSGN